MSSVLCQCNSKAGWLTHPHRLITSHQSAINISSRYLQYPHMQQKEMEHMQVKNITNKNSDQQVLKPNNAAVFTYPCSFNPSLHLRDCFILYRKLCSLVYNCFKQAQNTRIRENLNLFSRICVFSPSAH